MKLTIKQIQERTDVVYRRFRNKCVNRNDAIVVKEVLDLLMDDLIYLDKREDKDNYKTEQEDDLSKQIKVIKSLKMNNPLWDVE